MYFSRMTVRPGSVQDMSFREICTGPYEIHTAIWDMFSGSDVIGRDFLYRIDERKGLAVLYVVSEREPLYNGRIWQVETKPYNPVITVGQRFSFLLRANPIVTKTGVREDGKRDRHRHDVVMEAKRWLREEGHMDKDQVSEQFLVNREGIRWLVKRCDKYGFEVLPTEVMADGYQQMRFYKGGKKRTISISTIDFSGLLTVTDPECFYKTIGSGIGPAKGFGCGLLLIRPPGG